MCAEVRKIGFRLVERDTLVFKEINRWRVITGKQICILADFSSQRTCDRRLKKLMEYGFLTRKKIIYGLPSIYFLTNQSKALINMPNKPEHLRMEKISHDITVLNTAIYFNKIKHGFIISIHKSQGSEYPIVVIPVTMQHYMMLKRNLIYTGVTRGKKLVVLVGEEKALMMAVRDWKTQKRNTGLAERLQAFEERSQPLIEQSTP